ncbi:MAG TPA: hypothetical protein VG821_00255 [Rhizomicrobium sp.]|jgi:hypothetical protein|nr:hypothetical protein [Rhizomicrobium sp.]
MAKGQQRSNREKKKPKANAGSKSKPAPTPFALPPLSMQRGKKKP